MREFLQHYKNILLFVGIFAVLVFVYLQFFKNTSQEEPLAVEVVGQGQIGEDLVALLFRLQSLKLDQSIFTSPVFRSLKDFSQEIPSEPVGRPNPFAPVGN